MTMPGKSLKNRHVQVLLCTTDIDKIITKPINTMIKKDVIVLKVLYFLYNTTCFIA